MTKSEFEERTITHFPETKSKRIGFSVPKNTKQKEQFEEMYEIKEKISKILKGTDILCILFRKDTRAEEIFRLK